MKKALLIIMVMALAVSIVFLGISCKEPEVVTKTVTETVTETVEVEKEEAAADGKVVVRFNNWHYAEEVFREGLENTERLFEESHPNIDVQFESVSYEELMRTTMLSASAGTMADVVQFTPVDAGLIYSMGALEDLSNWFSPEELSADLPAGTFNSCVMNGELVLIPINEAPIVVFADKSLLEQAGLPLEIPGTWSEFKEAVRKISELGPGIYGYGARTSKDYNSAQWFLPVLWGHGGKLDDENGKVLLDSPETIAALEWYRELGENDEAPIGMATREVRVLFAQQKCGFMIDGPWTKDIIRSNSELGEAADDNWIAGLIPMAPDGNRYHNGNISAVAMAKQSKVKEEAAEVIKFFTSDEQARAEFFPKTNLFPAFNSLLDKEPYVNDPYVQVFREAAETAQSTVTIHYGDAHQALEFMATMIQVALLGGDIQESLDDTTAAIKILFGEEEE